MFGFLCIKIFNERFYPSVQICVKYLDAVKYYSVISPKTAVKHRRRFFGNMGTMVKNKSTWKKITYGEM